MEKFKHGDYIKYSGGNAEVIEQKGNILLIELLGSDIKPDKKFKQIDITQHNVEPLAEKKTADKQLIKIR